MKPRDDAFTKYHPPAVPPNASRADMAAALLAITAPLSFTADNFPDCTPAPACYPNRRAPHHGSLLNGACVRTRAGSRAHATLTFDARLPPCSPTQRSSTSGAATRARTGSPSITTAPRTSRCSRRVAGPRTPHSAPNEQTPADHTALQPWASRHTPGGSLSATHTCEPRLGQAQRPRARRRRRDGGQPEHVARVLLTPTPTLTLDLTLTLLQP